MSIALRGSARRSLRQVAWGLAAWSAAAGGAPSVPPASEARGERLFRQGDTMMTARLQGHSLSLPSAAARCINCHVPTAANRAAAARAAANTGLRGPVPAATVLGGAWLSQSRVRGGGPPTRYDAAALCRLLRVGINPAQIVVTTTMPRYATSDAQCEDLWNYLSAQP